MPTTPQHIQKLYALLGENTVLLPIPRGAKSPLVPGWPNITLEQSKDPEFRVTFRPKAGDSRPYSLKYAALLAKGNIGVLQGAASMGICSIDIDEDEWVAPVLEANPWLKETLQTRGHRGQNFWIRITDEGPIPSFNLSDETGAKVVEFRADGRQTVVYGRHPRGVDYAVIHEAPPVDKAMSDIVWPAGIGQNRTTLAVEHALEKFPIPETPRIEKRRKAAERALSCVAWSDNVTGFCKCPGEHKHTNGTKSHDCMVMVDATPTIFCFHTSCAEEVRDANLVLRTSIRETEAIELPNGSITRDEVADEVFRRLGEERLLYVMADQVVEVERVGESTRMRAMRANEIVSRMEQVASFVRRKKVKAKGSQNEIWVTEPSMLISQMGAELLACHASTRMLPEIVTVHNAPVLIEREGKLVAGCQGYHPERKILITSDEIPTEMPIAGAVEALTALLSEFQFATAGDEARGIAAFFTPALLWSGLIRRAPLSALEADESQSGKTTFQMMVSAVYNESPGYVASRKGGVGSQDESISTTLSRGHAVVLFDNLRDSMNSQSLEALITCNGLFPVRVPGKAEMLIDPRRVIFQMTGNGFSMTPDLANRSSIVKIRKRHGHLYKNYGDSKGIEDYVRDNHAFYLGCIFSVLQEWYRQGRQSTGTTEHDFHDWAGICDWIVQNIFGTVELLQGHRASQTVASSPFKSWMEQLAMAAKKCDDWEKWLRPTDLAAISETSFIPMPHQKDNWDVTMQTRHAGTCAYNAFGNSNTFPLVSCGWAHRARYSYSRPDGKGRRDAFAYAFTSSALPPDEKPAWGESESPTHVVL